MFLLFGVLKENETPRKIGLQVVESAANTFTAQEILLPNTKGETVFDLDRVEINYAIPIPAAVDDLSSVAVQIQRNTGPTPTALLNLNDQNLLYNADYFVASGTEAADITFAFLQEMGRDHAGWAEYIANDSVWLVVVGNANAAAQTIRGRLIGSIEKLDAKAVTALLLSQID